MMDKKNISVLYMEDDQGLARLLQKKLARDGYDVDVAGDGAEGLAMLDKGRYDMIIVDYNMPVLGGLDVIRRLSSPGPLPPTIMITAAGNETVAVEALKLGAADYIVKDAAHGYLQLLPIVIDRVLHDMRIRAEHKQLEAELIKAQKLESIGILAGGIAHDFNNLLTSIMGNISLAKMSLKPEDRIFVLLDKAEKISLRASALSNHLITFSTGGMPKKKPILLSDLIKDTVHLSLSGSNIRSEFAIDRDLAIVNVDEGQIHQAIHAIVQNAKESMPRGGVISVTAGNLVIGQNDVLPLPPGTYIRISIRDRGVGISAENLPKIFDPYFTTKEMGSQKGMGLGLAICYSIMKNHEGLITVESQVNEGSTFHIHLPAFPQAPHCELPPSLAQRGTGRILIMDDDQSVLDVAEAMLSRLGYTVVVSHDGEEAVARYQEALSSADPFNAVLLDLTVSGGMGGEEALEKLREIHKEVRAIVSSGYSQDPVMRCYDDNGFLGAVVKPYKIHELAETVARVVSGKDECR